ncbi:MAG TPA: nicotinate-nucleotide adenylyltransferase, partial [Armatimonadota bacterium]|nr:nicotinate-nucleotide adenylyltransferase [Armatimonadota bacterium]
MESAKNNLPRRIGIIGGTFDPVHIGHLIIAQEAWHKLELEKVVFVPAGIQPHKPDRPVTDREHRFNMVKLAVEDNPVFEVSRAELDRPGPSFTVDTLAEFKRIYGDETRLFFIAGADAILEIQTWHQPDKIIEYAALVAAARPGYDLSRAKKLLPEEFLQRIIFLEAPSVDISATQLRERVANGIPVRYLIPDPVVRYIIENRLF